MLDEWMGLLIEYRTKRITICWGSFWSPVCSHGGQPQLGQGCVWSARSCPNQRRIWPPSPHLSLAGPPSWNGRSRRCCPGLPPRCLKHARSFCCHWLSYRFQSGCYCIHPNTCPQSILKSAWSGRQPCRSPICCCSPSSSNPWGREQVPFGPHWSERVKALWHPQPQRHSLSSSQWLRVRGQPTRGEQRTEVFS